MRLLPKILKWIEVLLSENHPHPDLLLFLVFVTKNLFYREMNTMHLRLCGMREIASCLLAQAQVWKSEVCAYCIPHLPYWDLEPINLDLVSRDLLRNNKSHIVDQRESYDNGCLTLWPAASFSATSRETALKSYLQTYFSGACTSETRSSILKNSSNDSFTYFLICSGFWDSFFRDSTLRNKNAIAELAFKLPRALIV